MQITIYEAEIKQAVIEYLQRLMSIREGSNIDIDFRATRGDSGMTAIIDVTPGKPQPAQTVQTTQPVTPGKSISTKPITVTTAAVRDERVTVEASQEEPEPMSSTSNQEEQAPFDTQEQTEATASNDQADDSSTVVPMKQPEPEAPTAQPKKSLFGNIRHPKNA